LKNKLLDDTFNEVLLQSIITKYYYKVLLQSIIKMSYHTGSEKDGAIMILLFFIIIIPMEIIKTIYCPKRKHYYSIDDAKIARDKVKITNYYAMNIRNIVTGTICLYLICYFDYSFDKMKIKIINSIICLIPFYEYSSFTDYRFNEFDKLIKKWRKHY